MSLFPTPPLLSGYVHPSGLPDLPPLPKPIELDREIRWLGDDGRNVFIEVQGAFAAVAIRKGPLPYKPPPREEVKGFSRASRLRLFKLTNRLNFAEAGRSTFVTATWRDEVGRPDPKEITRVRSDFQRSIEKMADGELSGIWRVEWEVRQRGRFRGTYMPHVHTIYFRAPYLPIKAVEAAWARSLGWAGSVSLKMNEIDSIKKCLIYVGKYLAKLDVMCRLDIPSYLSKYIAGRKWGCYRKARLPLCDQTLIRVSPGPLLDRIREIATAAYRKTPQEDDVGFCVFGEAAKEIQKIIDEYCLSQPEEVIA